VTEARVIQGDAAIARRRIAAAQEEAALPLLEATCKQQLQVGEGT
jgi:hypothetical protein